MATLVDTNDSEISVIPSDCGKNVINDSAPMDTQTAGLSNRVNNQPDIFKTPVKSQSDFTWFIRLLDQEAYIYSFLFILDVSRNFSLANNTDDDVLSYQKVLDNIVLNDVKKCGPLLDGCKVKERSMELKHIVLKLQFICE